MASIFTRIVRGEIPSYKVAESERYLAFLDVFPLVPGHTLVIPKVEVDYLFDLDPDLLSDLLPFAQPIARAIEKVVPCERVGLSVIGLEVPHAHVHLVPINSIRDLDFSQPKKKMTPAEFEAMASAIRHQLSAS